MLIEELTRQRGQPQLHQEILSRVWGSEYQNDTDYLALWVRRLRAKLGDDDVAPRIIVPYLDVGYRLNVRLPREESDGS
jgi:two-component system KDP operon response regulator KdpE